MEENNNNRRLYATPFVLHDEVFEEISKKTIAKDWDSELEIAGC
jgi:hypothetical protein